jgi:hypothetical protein
MVHGVLHYCGYKDKGEAEELLMRSKEEKIGVPRGTVKVIVLSAAMFHVERLLRML